ncbi:DMT family transporter [Spirosoma endbachense]|uniref:EamA family transporter n=1 Tax=Spirosoma endbachense TaxID=2666025 RepID=A0A6P1VNH7_9BACT|nr:DMT family transporter [Spirosoma endbachense]QHV93662.1 EamA family transporter [Spirosoma endbachense]
MITQSPARKWAYFLALSIIWGSSYILLKKGLESFSYIAAATIRLGSAGLVFLPLGLAFFRKIPSGKWPLVVLSGLLSSLIPSYLFSLSQEHLQSSTAGILLAITPSFTFLSSLFFVRKTYSSLQILGLFLGLFCSVTLSLLSSTGLNLSINGYVFLIVIATLCYGININLVKQYLADVPPLHLSTVSVTLNGLLAFLFVYLPNQTLFQFTPDTISSYLALVTLGVVGTALAQVLHVKLIYSSSPLFASAITYLIPVVAIFWGILDNESFTVNHFIACLGILASVYLIRQEANQIA